MIDLLQLKADVDRSGVFLRAPTTEASVSAFELQCGQELPKDYRKFITEFADGGRAGCSLMRLDDWDLGYYSPVSISTAIKSPCLITPDTESEGGDWLEALGVEDAITKWDSNQWDPLYGTITIGEIGCGAFFYLIVNGPFQGRIFRWGDTPNAPPHFLPEIGYLEWVSEFLEERFRVRRDQERRISGDEKPRKFFKLFKKK